MNSNQFENILLQESAAAVPSQRAAVGNGGLDDHQSQKFVLHPVQNVVPVVNGAAMQPQDYNEPMSANELLSLDQEILEASIALQTRKKNGIGSRGGPKAANGANGSTTPRKKRGGVKQKQVVKEEGEDGSQPNNGNGAISPAKSKRKRAKTPAADKKGESKANPTTKSLSKRKKKAKGDIKEQLDDGFNGDNFLDQPGLPEIKPKTRRKRQVKHGSVKSETLAHSKGRVKSLDNRSKGLIKREPIDDEFDFFELDCRETEAFGYIKDHKNATHSGIYQIGKVLGSGMIGVACLCQHQENNILSCLKLMSIDKIKEKNLFKNIKDEVQIMYDLIGVAGVCQIEDIIINETKDVTIVMPFYALTDLWNFMKVQPGRHLTEFDARKVFSQLVDTFIGIHDRQIMHRDIKPENILVKNDNLDVCLSDFGLATRVGPWPQYESTRTGQAGTPCYYSYEIIKKIPYDERVDVWCLGVLLFEMLFGALPFSHAANDPRDYSVSISSLAYRFPSKSRVSQEARDLISKVLVPQETRITLRQIQKHMWIELDLDLVF